MNLSDFTNGEPLKQDMFSRTGVSFGEQGQLRVVGWFGKRKGDKYYIFLCERCSQDPELHGEGYFRSLKFSLYKKNPQLPCGCSPRVHYSEQQQVVRVRRACDRLGLGFIGWVGDFKKSSTKCRLFCKAHGVFDGGTIKAVVKENKGCRLCGKISAVSKITKDISYFIEKFRRTGFYSSNTTFAQVGVRGSARLWEVYCGVCEEVYISQTNNIVEGKRGCSCSFENQKNAYINGIYEDGNIIGLKFGVSVSGDRRAAQQNRTSKFYIENICYYTFETAAKCRAAEVMCKALSSTPLFSKEEVPDGFTETTTVENFHHIVNIYENLGGLLAKSICTESLLCTIL